MTDGRASTVISFALTDRTNRLLSEQRVRCAWPGTQRPVIYGYHDISQGHMYLFQLLARNSPILPTFGLLIGAKSASPI